MNNPASATQATNGTASARKAPATQSFQVLKSSPEMKHPEREQREQDAPQRVVRDEAVRVAHVDEIHRDEHRRPLTKLDRRHFEPTATPRQMGPAYADAKKSRRSGS